VARVGAEGISGTGVGVQSVLWSDANLFAELDEEKSNSLMYDLTRYALTLLKGRELTNPIAIMDEIYSQVLS
jgi:hypothetical protein